KSLEHGGALDRRWLRCASSEYHSGYASSATPCQRRSITPPCPRDLRDGTRVKLPALLGANNYHYLRGGSERYFLELGRLLSARGHSVAHLSTADARNEPAPGPAAFVPPVELAPPRARDVLRFHYSRRAARALTGLLRTERVDLAHLHIYYGQLTPSILAPLVRAGLPIVQTLHEYKPLRS